MVEGRLRRAQHLDHVFHALADSTRRDMLTRLSRGPLSIGELAAPLDMSFAAASKHVKVLEGAGLIQRRIQGRRHECRLVADRLADAQAWLSFYQQFWNHRLDALAQALEAEPAAQRPRRRRKRT